MRKFTSRLALPVKLAMMAVSLFLLLLLIMQHYIGASRESSWPWGVTDASRVGVRARGVTENDVDLQIRAPVPPTADIRAVNSDPGCPSGFYSRAELKPHLDRPWEDPRAPGSAGGPFVSGRLGPAEQREKQEGLAKNCFNQFASDRISVHRGLGSDTRHPDCLEQRFPRCPPLPSTSVIIVFHNEAWSALLRTVYSVLHTAPAALLTEVLLVDDASTDDHLKGRLDELVAGLGVVRVLRQAERRGCVSARLLGARAARGAALTFLDSHCECFPGWLEPLLARVAEEPTAVVSPGVRVIDKDSLRFSRPVATARASQRGSFDWSLAFGWEPIPREEGRRRKDETYPVRTPAFTGGIFSISKAFFQHIGTYDEQMEIWGGENIEMSFRVWLCGGRVEILPCSVVGHIFRTKSPHTFPKGTSVVSRNLVRLAEVWMDDFKHVVYRRNKMAAKIAKENTYGDISDRLRLKERLNCKNFSWFLHNVYPEAYVPEITPAMSGELRNSGTNSCLHVGVKSEGGSEVTMYDCHNMGASQYFEYTSQMELRHNLGIQLCLTAVEGGAQAAEGGAQAWAEPCRLRGRGTAVAPEQVWRFTSGYLLENPSSGKCLTVGGSVVVMSICDPTDLTQHWAFI